MFSKQKQQSEARGEEVYSVLLLVTVPILAIMIMLVIIMPIRRATDASEQRQAKTLSQIISTAIKQNIGFDTRLQAQIEDLKVANDQLSTITVAEKGADGSFNVTASTDNNVRGKSSGDTSFNLSTANKQIIQKTITLQNGDKTITTTAPIVEGDAVLGAVSVGISAKVNQVAFKNAMTRSIVVSCIMVVIIALVLLNHLYYVRHIFKNSSMPEAADLPEESNADESKV